jgi:hypothetical protein
MVNGSSKSDPIRTRYYVPLEHAELILDILFYLTAATSIITLLVDSTAQPTFYDVVQTTFVLLIVAVFILGLAIRLYFFPRAHEKRYQDFLSHVFEVPLSHEQTTGYYNSSISGDYNRIAAQLLENSLYSKDTALAMARAERTKIAIYVIIWLLVALNRASGLAAVVVVVQIIFSEQLLSRWFRLEWLRREFERTYDELFRLLQNRAKLKVVVLEILGRYEFAKATAGITLSSRIFKKRSAATDAEWARIKKLLEL